MTKSQVETNARRTFAADSLASFCFDSSCSIDTGPPFLLSLPLWLVDEEEAAFEGRMPMACAVLAFTWCFQLD